MADREGVKKGGILQESGGILWATTPPSRYSNPALAPSMCFIVQMWVQILGMGAFLNDPMRKGPATVKPAGGWGSSWLIPPP